MKHHHGDHRYYLWDGHESHEISEWEYNQKLAASGNLITLEELEKEAWPDFIQTVEMNKHTIRSPSCGCYACKYNNMILRYSDNTQEFMNDPEYYPHICTHELDKTRSENPEYMSQKIEQLHINQWQIFGLKSVLDPATFYFGKCSCSHRIKHQLYVKNKINKTILMVGVVCIKKTTGDYFGHSINELVKHARREQKVYKANLDKYNNNKKMALTETIKDLKFTGKCEFCKTRIEAKYKRCYSCFSKLKECSEPNCHNKIKDNYIRCYTCNISKYTKPPLSSKPYFK